MITGALNEMKSKTRLGQSFSRTRPVYRFSEKLNRVVKTDEVIDIQEEVNSQYDETFYANLERYYESHPSLPVGSEVAEDFGLRTIAADKALEAFELLRSIRARHNIPDTVTDAEIKSYLTEKLDDYNAVDDPAPHERDSVSVDVDETNLEGGVSDET